MNLYCSRNYILTIRTTSDHLSLTKYIYCLAVLNKWEMDDVGSLKNEYVRKVCFLSSHVRGLKLWQEAAEVEIPLAFNCNYFFYFLVAGKKWARKKCLIVLRIIQSATYCDQILLAPLYINYTQNTAVNGIILLL